MENVTISTEKLKDAYSAADVSTQVLFGQLFPQVFQKPITERVKTFQDAIAVTGKNAIWVASQDEDTIAREQLKLITLALNEGKPHDHWYPTFEIEDGKFSFIESYRNQNFTELGFKLAFATEELATYAGKQFEALYIKMLS